VSRKRVKTIASLPPKEQQDQQDLVWRLAIHRVDLRHDNVRHWRFLDGYAHLVDALFDSVRLQKPTVNRLQ
jgi:hypothetical protein